MSSEIYMRKTADGVLVPDDEQAAEAVKKLKVGGLLKVKITQARNARFLRKFMALVTLGYNAFEPPEVEYRGLVAQKSFHRFRNDLTIAAGFYTATTDIRGTLRLEAKSLSFASMSEEEFEEVFSAVANVLLQSILKRYTRADIDRVIERVLDF